MTEDRQEALARGLALIEQGYSYRQASEVTGVEHTTLFRAAQRTATEQPDLPEKIRARAAELASEALEKMHERIRDVDDRHLASWAITGARLGGLLDAQDGSLASDMGELVNRLTSGGNTVTVGVKVEKPQP